MGESREKVLTRIRKERGERFLKRIIFLPSGVCVGVKEMESLTKSPLSLCLSKLCGLGFFFSPPD
jgi:hypothetical protein